MSTVKQCDRCFSVERVSTVSVVTGRRTDAAGSSEDTGITLDLCEACQAAKFRQLCKDAPGAVAKALAGVNHG